MRIQATRLYEAEGDKGIEKPKGPCLGFVAYSPNEQVHSQSERILREINAALKLKGGALVENPPPDYTKIKLIRYTSDWLVYEVSYQTMAIVNATTFDGPTGIIKATHRSKIPRTVKHRYILVKK